MKPYASASLALCLSLACLPAVAGEFFELTSSDEGDTVSIDIDSFKVRDGHPSAWMLSSSMKPQNNALSQKALYVADCASESLGVKSFILYAGKAGGGDVVGSRTYPNSMVNLEPVAPGTLGARQLDILCHMQTHGTAMGFSGMLDTQILAEQMLANNLKVYESASPELRTSMCADLKRRYAESLASSYDRFVKEAEETVLNSFCGGVPKPKPPAAKAKPKGK